MLPEAVPNDASEVMIVTEKPISNDTGRQNGGTGKSGQRRERPSHPHVRLGNNHVRLPRSRIVRIALGSALVAGGILGFLPVLGFWMIPLGLLVLSQDLPMVRRWRRRLAVKWGRRGKNGNGENGA